MAIGLRAGVSFCEASGHLVFLDIEADRYFGLSGEAEAAFRRCAQALRLDYSPSDLDGLLGSGLLIESGEAAPLQPCPPPPIPRASLIDRPLPSPKPFRLAAAVAGLMRARLELRLRLRDDAARRPHRAERARPPDRLLRPALQLQRRRPGAARGRRLQLAGDRGARRRVDRGGRAAGTLDPARTARSRAPGARERVRPNPCYHQAPAAA